MFGSVRVNQYEIPAGRDAHSICTDRDISGIYSVVNGHCGNNEDTRVVLPGSLHVFDNILKEQSRKHIGTCTRMQYTEQSGIGERSIEPTLGSLGTSISILLKSKFLNTW